MQTSVVIPCFNQGQYLAEAIQSCLTQTIPVEIIVVNDGSTDNTQDVIKAYSLNYNFKHIVQENKGLSAARNAGIELATGTKILCLDADDRIFPTYAEKAKDIEGVVVVGVHNFGDFEDWVLPYHDLSLEAFKVQNRITCASWFDKSDWVKYGGFDESMKEGKEDYDFWLTLIKNGVHFTTIPECLFEYRMKTNRMSLDADKKEAQLLKYIHKKHQDIWTKPQ